MSNTQFICIEARMRLAGKGLEVLAVTNSVYSCFLFPSRRLVNLFFMLLFGINIEKNLKLRSEIIAALLLTIIVM